MIRSGDIVVRLGDVRRLECERRLKFGERLRKILQLETQLAGLRVQLVIKRIDVEARLQSIERLLLLAQRRTKARDVLQCLQIVLVSLHELVENRGGLRGITLFFE